MEAIGRIYSPVRAVELAAERSGSTYDPAIAGVFVEHGLGWFERLGAVDPWDAVLALEPEPRRTLEGEALDRALVVAADFIDLKSPFMGGHSRRCSRLAADAAQVLGLADEATERLRRAALLHDFGTTAVSNSILDKPGPLTRDERERMELHAMVTDQLLRRVSYTARLAVPAAGAHERLDGSGYHRRPSAGDLDDAARIVAAADCYQAMTSERPQRAALSASHAAAELRAESAAGRLDGEAVERVLAAAGHRRIARPVQPGRLTAREIDVVRLMAMGLTTREIADRLVISTKTADHHVQHIYRKIGASTRGAAALFAIENGLLPSEPGVRMGRTPDASSGAATTGSAS
jgi:DNA-binding CsgD family transcriptional regulator